jgi:DNA-binding SARP family transcriptional activator
MNRLSLALLGPIQVLLGATPLQNRSIRVQALLSYLAVEYKEQHRREALMELLWPGLPQKSAQVNLRQTLYQLKKAIPAIVGQDGKTATPLILADRHRIQINPDAAIDLDLHAFDKLATQGSKAKNIKLLEEAESLYRGDFLSDFYLPDSEPFEAWANARREAYRRQMLDLLQTLAALQMDEKRFEQAETAVRRQLEIDPLRDIAHRQLIELLARSGRRSEALAHYDTYCQLLADELQVDPSTATLMLHQKITSGYFDTTPENQVRGYVLGDEIGRGAFGVVYRANNLQSDVRLQSRLLRHNMPTTLNLFAVLKWKLS